MASESRMKELGMAWVTQVRLRVIVFVIGVPLAAFGAITLGPAWLTLPIVGVAVAVVTVSVNKLTQRLGEGVCFTCGQGLRDVPPGEHGKVCPGCGALNQHRPMMLARTDTKSTSSDV
ncbi:MAG: hypothetical protein JNK58_00370 [Phycisphaerae bacterium]|nr:hypothetical protein [Phycisphaerae bacterium]